MDVSCPQCSTLYEFDDSQVRARDGVTLQCSQCDHLFRLKTDSGPQDERQRRWMVRDADSGDILYFATFQTLHEWIMEGRVSEEDAISRTGKSWKQLKEMGEFAPIFQVLASIAELTGAGGATEEEKPETEVEEITETSPPAKRRRRQATNLQFETGEAAATKPAPKRAPQTTPAVKRRTHPTPAPEKRRPQPTPMREPAPTPGQGASLHRTSDHQSTVQRAERPEMSTPAPRSEKERFVPSSSTQLDAEEEDWTLGELEYVDAETQGKRQKDVDLSSVQRRRWPALLVVLLLIGAGVGVWQREALEDLLADAGLSETGQQVDDSVEGGPEEALAQASRQMNESLKAADAARRGAQTAQLVPRARQEVEASVEAAGAEAAEAGQPSTAELLAAGRRSVQRGNSRQAIDRFRLVLEESPEHPEALLGMGQARLGLGQYDRAINKFETVRRIKPDMGEALIGIGTAHRSLGQPELALEAYEAYLRHFPDGAQASIAEFQSQQLRE